MLELKAAIMGLVEGLTEYLPVSSTGHLILTGQGLGFERDLGHDLASAFEIFIKLGAIFAVLVAYPRRFAGLLDFRAQEGFAGWRGIGLLLCTTAPALVAGKLLHEHIQQDLFGAKAVAVGLAVGAVWILWVEGKRPCARFSNLDELGWREAVGIGLFQCLALWPGFSRSGATILGAMVLGLDRKTATEYSFFAAIPVLCAASLWSLIGSYQHLQASHVTLFAIGLAVSFVSAFAAVRWLLRFVSHHTLTVFAWYRLVLAAVVLGALWRGILQP